MGKTQRGMKYVGLDVHQAVTVASVPRLLSLSRNTSYLYCGTACNHRIRDHSGRSPPLERCPKHGERAVLAYSVLAEGQEARGGGSYGQSPRHLHLGPTADHAGGGACGASGAGGRRGGGLVYGDCQQSLVRKRARQTEPGTACYFARWWAIETRIACSLLAAFLTLSSHQPRWPTSHGEET